MANPKVPSEDVVAFRERHQLDQEALDLLFGFSSKGRTTRRWEAVGAPRYVAVLMSYVDTYGLQLMLDMTNDLKAALKKQAKKK